jgi:hypothetical protein
VKYGYIIKKAKKWNVIKKYRIKIEIYNKII